MRSLDIQRRLVPPQLLKQLTFDLDTAHSDKISFAYKINLDIVYTVSQ